VTALRAYAEKKFRAAYEFVAFSKRNQKSAFSILADQKLFHANPFASGQFWNGERCWGGPKFNS
jgi:hypothetical protein